MKKKGLLITLGIVIFILIIILVTFITIPNQEENSDNLITSTIDNSVGKELIDNQISLKYYDSREIHDNYKLVVTNLNDKLNIDDMIALYDISIKDEENNIINVKNTSMKISIPYNNTQEYNKFKIYYLNEYNKIKKIISATYEDGKIIFNLNHLSKYAIVATKEEPTTKRSTTIIFETTESTTTTSRVTTRPRETVTTKRTKTPTAPTTKTTTTRKKTTTTTEPTTTTSRKTTNYTYTWSHDKDAVGQQFLYLINEKGERVSGSVLVNYIGSSYSERIDVPTHGVVLIKSIVTISDIR